MAMTLIDGEPAAGPWRTMTATELVESLLAIAGDASDRTRIVAVDGRSASGKSTLAGFLNRAIPGSALVHTDDLAWHEPMFDWGHLLRDGVLAPLHRGEAVSLRPPAWEARGRPGRIEVPADAALVIIEGVGANQRGFADLIDATIWTQSDFAEAERRGIARDIVSAVNGDAAQSIAFWHEWMAQEVRFLEEQRPWSRADLVVAGTEVIPLAADEFAVAIAGPGRLG